MSPSKITQPPLVQQEANRQQLTCTAASELAETQEED
jgi:hypothetical protein